jgi:hypothetical protein
MTDPFFIDLTISSVISKGAFFPGINAVVIIISTSYAYFLKSSA